MSAKPHYVFFDTMVWPLAGEALDEAEWQLRYGHATKYQRMLAASILSAYQALVNAPVAKQRQVTRIVKKASR